MSDDNTAGAAVATVEHVARSAGVTELLYRRHGQRVLRYCLGCLRRPADAEDALQQTFLQAHRALGRGAQPVSEVAWLLAIARNVCVTRADAQRRRNRAETSEDPSVLAEVAPAVVSDDGISADVQAAFARLSDRQRQALFLREWHGYSYAEIATALEISEPAVETLIFRARRALAGELSSRRRRLPSLSGGLGWLRGWLGPTAAKVAAVAATASVAAGTAITLDVHHQPARRHISVLTPAAAVKHSPAPVIVRVSPRRATALRKRQGRGSTSGGGSPATSGPAAAAAATPVESTGSPVARDGLHAGASPSVPQAPPSDPLIGAGAGTVATTVDSAAQTVGNALPPAAPATSAVAQTVDTATQTVSGTVDQAAGAAQPAATTVAQSVTKLLPGH